MKSKFSSIQFESIVALGLIIISVIILNSTFSMKSMALDPVGPALIPRLVAILLGGLSCIELIHSIRKPKAAQTDETAGRNNGIQRYSAVISIGIIFLYILALKPIGFIISSTVFLFFQIWLCYGKTTRKRLVTIALVSSVAAVTIYFTFSKGFALNLPVGILG